MAFNLIFEFSENPDWMRIHRAVAGQRCCLELFPISRCDGEAIAGIGISLPLGAARRPEGWRELRSVAQELLRVGGTLTELYSGRRFTIDTLDELRLMVAPT